MTLLLIDASIDGGIYYYENFESLDGKRFSWKEKREKRLLGKRKEVEEMLILVLTGYI